MEQACSLAVAARFVKIISVEPCHAIFRRCGGFGDDVCGFTVATRPSEQRLVALRRALYKCVSSVITDAHSQPAQTASSDAYASAVALVFTFVMDCDDETLIGAALDALTDVIPRVASGTRQLLWREHCAGTTMLMLLARLQPVVSAKATSLLARLLPALKAREAAPASTAPPTDASSSQLPTTDVAKSGLNAASTFAGRLRTLSMEGIRRAKMTAAGAIAAGEKRASAALASASQINKPDAHVLPSLLTSAIINAAPQPPRQVIVCHATRSLLQHLWEPGHRSHPSAVCRRPM